MNSKSSRIRVALLLAGIFLSLPRMAFALGGHAEYETSLALRDFSVTSPFFSPLYPKGQATVVGWAMGPLGISYTETTRDAANLFDGRPGPSMFGIEQQDRIVASIILGDDRSGYRLAGPGPYQAACSAALAVFNFKGWKRPRPNCMMANTTIWGRFFAGGQVVSVEGITGYFVKTTLRAPMDLVPRRKSKGSVILALEDPESLGLENGVPYRPGLVAQRIAEMRASRLAR